MRLKKGIDFDKLNEYYFRDNLVRGGNMGWAHKIDRETREISFVDEEYAKSKDNYSKIGGLEALIEDLIKDGMVIF